MDDLDIPEFLDLRIPANLAAWKEGRRNWRPVARRAEAKRKQNLDSQGNRLPEHMEESSWAFLRELENAEAEKAKAAKAARDEQKAIERNARQQVREAAKAAKRAAREAERQRKADARAAKAAAREAAKAAKVAAVAPTKC